MASSATSRLRLDKQATGDNPNAWGIRLNTALDLVDESQGVNVITLNGDVTLTTSNYASDQARRFVLKLTGTGLQGNAPALVTIPSLDKGYQVHNLCSGVITVGTSAANAVTIRAGQICFVYCDGAGTPTVYVDDPSLDTIKAPAADLNMTEFKVTNLAPGVAVSDAARIDQTGPYQVAQAQAWATQTNAEVVPGQGYGAKYYQQQAATSASQAAASAASINPANLATKAQAAFLFAFARS